MIRTGWHARAWSDAYFKVLDVAARVGSGVGSYGVQRFYVLLAGEEAKRGARNASGEGESERSNPNPNPDPNPNPNPNPNPSPNPNQARASASWVASSSMSSSSRARR